MYVCFLCLGEGFLYVEIMGFWRFWRFDVSAFYLPFRAGGTSGCASTRFCHSCTSTMPSPPTPRCGIVTRRSTPACASSAISRSVLVGDAERASMWATVTMGGSALRKLRTSGMRLEDMPAPLEGISSNILLLMYSMNWGTSRKLRSAAMATARPVSSSFSSSSLFDMVVVVVLVDWEDFLRGLADEGDETERLRPIAAAAPVLLGLVIREERAAVAWNDMLLILNVYNTVWMRGGKISSS